MATQIKKTLSGKVQIIINGDIRFSLQSTCSYRVAGSELILIDTATQRASLNFAEVTTTQLEPAAAVAAPPFTSAQELADFLDDNFFFESLTSFGTDLYDAVIDAGGLGDYVNIKPALDAGLKTLFIKKGTYAQTADLSLPSGALLKGENSEVYITFAGNTQLKAQSPTASKSGGTITVTNGSAAVVGVGTSFAAGDVGKYIRVQNEFYLISGHTDALNITLSETYQGDTTAGLSYFLREMLTGVMLENLVVVGNGTNTLDLVLFDGVLNSRISACVFRDNNQSNFKSVESGVLSFINVLSRSSAADGFELETTFSANFSACEGVNNAAYGYNLVSGNGLTIDNSHANNNNLYGIQTAVAQTIVTSCQASQNKEGGIRVLGTSTDTKIEGCAMLNNEQIGVVLEADRFIVDSCTFDDHSDNGVRIEGNEGVVSNCNIINSSIGIETRTGGGNNVTIIGNTTNNNTAGGIVANFGDNMTIGHNISTNNGVHGISILADNNIINGNVCTGNTNNGINVTGDNNIISSNRSYSNDKGIALSAAAGNNLVSLNNTTTNTTAGIEDLGVGNTLVNNI